MEGIRSRKRHSSELYYHLGLPAKILPFHPVPFSSNHAWVVQREGRGEHVGESECFFCYLNNSCILPSLLRAQCPFFTCPLLEKYSRNSLRSLLPRRARSSRCQQKEERTPLSLLPTTAKNNLLPLLKLAGWKQC